jgi:hypothetical protein
MTGIFMFELVIKVLVFGFVCNGSNSYLKIGWNVMDFLIVLVSIFGLLPLGNGY